MENGSMRLYDKDIAGLKRVLEGLRPRKLPPKPAWKCTEQEALVLRSDMAFELGGSEKEAVSGLAFTTDADLFLDAGNTVDAVDSGVGANVAATGIAAEKRRNPIECPISICSKRDAGITVQGRNGRAKMPESSVFLIGGDLPEIRKDISYARLTVLLLDELEGLEPQQLYLIFRKIDYTRYHIYPEGYMMRISAVKEREPVRISAQALKDGMDFAGVGACFAKQYGAHPKVKAVQTCFVTDQTADYALLRSYAHRFEQITQSMNQVFQGFSMDCGTCSQRQLCEEIDGLKELHRRMPLP